MAATRPLHEKGGEVPMFIYYFDLVDGPFAEVEASLLRCCWTMSGWANLAYRQGERLYARIGTKSGRVAKTVAMTVGEVIRGPNDTVIPVEWQATGAPGLFPRMEGEIVAAGLGEQTQIAFRGNYHVPLGEVGEALDRWGLHRVAEVSVKSFLDSIASSIRRDLGNTEPQSVLGGA